MLKQTFLCLIVALSWSLEAQSFWSMSPYEVRDQINQRIMAVEAETPIIHSVCDCEVIREGRLTPVRVYAPCVLEGLPIIVMIHGGGWVAGNLDTHDNLARYLCRETNSLVVSVGYQNAPEGKFPLPLEQCYDALLWIVGCAQQFQADPKNLAVVGDSAGGNIAAALCLLVRDRQGPHISCQVLINPAPDLSVGGTLEQQHAPRDTLRWFAKQYLISAEDLYHPYVSPSCAQDLSRLPPALVILADQDPLFEDGQKYANRLCTAGVPTHVYVQCGSGHLAGRAARAALSAQESLNVAVEKLNQTFSQTCCSKNG